MMMSASVALVRDRYSFFKLRNFVYSVNILITLFILILVIPAGFLFHHIKPDEPSAAGSDADSQGGNTVNTMAAAIGL